MTLQEAQAPAADLHIDGSLLANRTVLVVADVNSRNPVAPLFVFGPVSYRFTIDVDFSTGRRRYVIGMDCSCYPSYEVYINDKPFLQEPHSCATPLGLLQGRVRHLLVPGVTP